MPPFPEAAGALAVLQEAGLHTGMLTISTTDAAEQGLKSAGLRDRFNVVMGSDAVRVYKPQPRVYRQAIERLGIESGEACLVAAHAWDVAGAMRAGLHGAWVARSERWLVPVVPDPDVRGDDLEDVARKLVAARTPVG